MNPITQAKMINDLNEVYDYLAEIAGLDGKDYLEKLNDVIAQLSLDGMKMMKGEK